MNTNGEPSTAQPAQEHQPMRLNDAVAAVFANDGPLAAGIDGYEPREGQRAMAGAVADVIEDGGTLLAEAGTGTGKTLAYLIPAILSRQRVLVSTGTKNLQEQIFSKDLPALQKALDIPFTATVMKGRSNYLCLHRYEMYRDGVDGNASAAGRLIETGDRILLPIVDAWAKTTETGDRAELRDLPEDLALWKDIAADVETCLGQECPRYSECFVTKMRQRAAESDVVIVNHHLLCADASVRHNSFGEVIPACPTLVVDEAHQLEDVATHYFGIVVSNFRIDDLVRDGMHFLGSIGARHASPLQAKEDIHRALTRVERHGREFFARLSVGASSRRGSEQRARYTSESISECFEDGMMVIGALESLEAALALSKAPPGAEGEPAASDDAEALQRRAGELGTQLRFLLRAGDPDFVFYLETRGRGMFLCASPVDVSRIVQEAIFDRARAAILTSATLAVDNSFEYVRGRLGIRDAVEVHVASEFDYATQAILYLPRRMPPPKSPLFAEAAAREIIDVLTRTEGRAFVLFTSYAVLRSVQQFLQMSLRYPLLVQGTAPRSTLIEQFRMTPNAVLLATSSFWQGVDVVGDALSCVIVDKLPFASPGDPVTAARMESIAAQGGDAFADYQVPLAILALQQGLGRLIRHRTDRGVLAILDPRLRTMGYGRRFMDSLPPAPITMDAEDVSRFLARTPAAAIM
jgi:ATP-dependent DNA helicase DinG